jgi:hypothetical protein
MVENLWQKMMFWPCIVKNLTKVKNLMIYKKMLLKAKETAS